MRGFTQSNFYRVTAVALTSIVFMSLALHSRAENSKSAEAKKDIRELLDHFFTIATKKEWSELGQLYADDCKIFCDGATTFDKHAYLELLRSDELEVKEWKLSDVEIEVSGDQRMAWCRYRGYFDHGDFRVSTAETLIFTRQPSWKIAHAHASVNVLKEETSTGG